MPPTTGVKFLNMHMFHLLSYYIQHQLVVMTIAYATTFKMYYETLKSSRQNYLCGSLTKLEEKHLERIKEIDQRFYLNKTTTKWK